LAQAVTYDYNRRHTYIPPGLEHGTPLFFAADNIDFSEDIHDGKNPVHATLCRISANP
jgi:hypothetical protein